MGKVKVKVSKVLTRRSNQSIGSLSFGLFIKVKANYWESESKNEQSADQEKQSVQWVSQLWLDYQSESE